MENSSVFADKEAFFFPVKIAVLASQLFAGNTVE